jgi:hypothetical protein
MRNRVREVLLLGLLLKCFVGLSGCSSGPTSINPPSGPVGMEVCFDPAPAQFVSPLGGETCGWYVVVGMAWANPPSYHPVGYVYENCFEIPSTLNLREALYPYEPVTHEVAPGDVLKIRVEADLGVMLYGWWCNTRSMPTPFYEIGAKTGTFTVTE